MNSQYENLKEQYSSKVEHYYELTRNEMLQFIPQGVKTMLEVGCSGGGFAELVKKNRPGVVVWGIEPDRLAATVAAKRIDHAICGMFEGEIPELDGKKFDCIVFNDVLEHLVNPDKTLVETKQYLTENGVVVASIPNILFFYQILQILQEQDWKYEDAGIMDNTHLRFFTKKSIVRMFETCGFEIVRIEGINPIIGRKYRVINSLLLGRLRDWKYVQFAVQAKLKGS